jgi:phthalate 4,5-dioxygenase oxygenase subunit
MLSAEDTDLLCRVGPGTPMGDLMRRYWIPVGYSWELELDGQPQRIRVLGEDLLLWRDSDGVVAATQQRCPHRGTNLFFGRNEESGLRCAYHGWKFDVTGSCVDMPNEPAYSNFKTKVKITAYRGDDFGQVTWIYMGPDQKNPPGMPEFEFGLVPEENLHHNHKLVYECNWMQALEGELDTTHVYFLHSRLDPEASPKYGLYLDEKSAKFHIVETDVGMTYGAERAENDGSSYWRTTQMLFPFYGMFPGTPDDGTTPVSIYVPIDDYHTLHLGVRWNPTRPLKGLKPDATLPDEPGALADGVGPMKPEQRGRFFATSWPAVAPENDFMMDLDTKKRINFTGIPSVRLQDSAVIWSMGPIMDRMQEHLGTADATIIKVRRKLITAAKALREHGTVPPGVENPELYNIRSCASILPAGADWLIELGDWHHARTTQHPNPNATANRKYAERIGDAKGRGG